MRRNMLAFASSLPGQALSNNEHHNQRFHSLPRGHVHGVSPAAKPVYKDLRVHLWLIGVVESSGFELEWFRVDFRVVGKQPGT